MSLEEDISARLVGVRNRFVGRLATYESDIRRLQRLATEGSTNIEAVREIKFLVHKMRGPAKTLGFGDLGTCAQECENQLELLLESLATVDTNVMPREFLNPLLGKLASIRTGENDVGGAPP